MNALRTKTMSKHLEDLKELDEKQLDERRARKPDFIDRCVFAAWAIYASLTVVAITVYFTK